MRPEPQYPERIYQVIGVVPDTKYSDLREDLQIQAFVPIAQLPVTAQAPWMSILIASRVPAAAQLNVQHMLNEKYPGIETQFSNFHQNIVDHLVGDRVMTTALRFLRFSRSSPRRRRTPRRSLLLPRAAPPRDRHSHGPRSQPRPCRCSHARQCLHHAVGRLACRNLARPSRRARSQHLDLGLKPWDPVTLAAAAALLAVVTLAASLVPSCAPPMSIRSTLSVLSQASIASKSLPRFKNLSPFRHDPVFKYRV